MAMNRPSEIDALSDGEALRRPVIWTVSVSRMSRLMADLMPEFDDRAKIESIQLGFENAVSYIRRRLHTEHCDVLVAGGSNGAYLKNRVPLPVVLVRPTGLDLFAALSRARRVSERVGIITHETDLPEFAEFQRRFGLHIEQRQFLTAEDARHAVAELVALGVRAIVGTGMVTDLAEQAGVTGVLLYSPDSIREAFESAIDMARVVARAGTQPAAHERSAPRRQRPGTRYRLENLLGESAAMRQLRGRISSFARSDATVLLQGPTGSGKELAAQALHSSSARRAGPFVAVNCGAIAESLLEAELFGHEEGAFTGSRRGGRVGLIESAHRGSLFLDEIGEMPLALQTRLLRVLEEREVTRVGSVRAQPVDLRVIAATHMDLAALVAERRFRADLFFRLNVLRIDVPSLAQRSEDIGTLLAGFLRRMPGGERVRLSAPALQRLSVYAWPGNVRELRNLAERLAVLGLEKTAALVLDLPTLMSACPELQDRAALPLPAGVPLSESVVSEWTAPRRTGEALSGPLLQTLLAQHQGDRAALARALGVSRTTLWRRLKSLPDR